MGKSEDYQEELNKLNEIFAEIDQSKARLVKGLIEDAAYLYAENKALRENMRIIGMVKVHPEYPEMQKKTVAADQYLKNVNSYAVIIKALNGVLSKNTVEDLDELEDYA